mmetsp:Transcript_64733/g.72364  ORF Transcript_64733/g.72364 Transcript_64733/m.72364 type:complete len:93 (+) Transcript_64733:95-373(+)
MTEHCDRRAAADAAVDTCTIMIRRRRRRNKGNNNRIINTTTIKQNKVFVRECGILNISASRDPFSLKLDLIFKSITSTNISERVISYTRCER